MEHYRLLHQVHWRRRHLGEVHGVVFAPAAIRRSVRPAAGRLDEQWRRALPLIPLALATARRGAAKPENANSRAGILACALAPASLPLGLLHPGLFAVPVALVGWFVVADPPLLRFVHRERGAAFTAYFMAVHPAVHVVLVTGLAAGSLRVLRGAPA
ncbi:hypothetical protein ACIBQ1_46100 [Nonomuraea sp. NPDC050153]|uniref:hypothetical protein n=1 Tax=Nonomuraea sp. NPDC050153 TaxID=3364359 RepID=UPI0037AC12A5